MACKAGRLSLKDKEEVGAVIKGAVAVKSWITLYVKGIQNSNLDKSGRCMHTDYTMGLIRFATNIPTYHGLILFASITQFGMD